MSMKISWQPRANLRRIRQLSFAAVETTAGGDPRMCCKHMAVVSQPPTKVWNLEECVRLTCFDRTRADGKFSKIWGVFFEVIWFF